MQPILTTEEVAALLKCSTRTVEDHARAGRIPGAKFGEGWVFAADLVVAAVKEMSLEQAKRRRPAPAPEAAGQAGVLGVIKAVPGYPASAHAVQPIQRGRGRPRKTPPGPTNLMALPGMNLLPDHAVREILAAK